ncbi:MAG: hypothetical protein K5888_06580 [Lachnospiraceae bacterium]|nr:hypothetical protein [Lachnospiraceae bacterium]
MQPDLKVKYFKPEKPGVYKNKDGSTVFCFDAAKYFGKAKKLGLILYDRNGREARIPFKASYGTGSLYALSISNLDLSDHTYNFYVDDEIVNDPYGKAFTRTENFGVPEDKSIRGLVETADFDWEDDQRPEIPYENSVMYGLNVRAFTMHSSSKVKNKGTFEGVIQKLDYLKDLGVTSVVLMPVYEFDECLAIKNSKNPKNIDEMTKSAAGARVNCWGFQDALYFAPKAHYSSKNDPTLSFKELVKAAHKKGMEIILHFYFSPGLNPAYIMEALKFWTVEYHVDGFRISGFDIPFRFILMESILMSSKLWFAYIPGEDASMIPAKPYLRNVSCDNGNYRNTIRMFNKADEGCLNEFISLQKNNPSNVALINYVCDYDGFSLRDLYTYERKHNEDNGENNFDGNNANHSWNCGLEGETRKKHINEARARQIKNILTFVLLGAGTPYIFSGDEFGNSRFGNNNAYCMDNEKGYVEWKDNSFARDILSYTKNMISLRMRNPIFHMKDELKNIDTLSCGYPDLSYHGFEAWRPDLGYNSRAIGMFYYGPCCGNRNAGSYYIGINMHWENHRLAVPKLPKGYVYSKIFDTSGKDGISKDNEIPVNARSVCIYEVRAKGDNKK